MKFSTFLILAMICGIALIYIGTNPGHRLPGLSSQQREAAQGDGAPSASGAPNPNLPATEGSRRFELSGRVMGRLNDGLILVSGTVIEMGKVDGNSGEFAVAGRSDTSLLANGQPIRCEVQPAGNYQVANGGYTRIVPKFTAVRAAPGAARAGEWMREGNPLERGAYNPH
jgi:hypothetical protein